MDEGRLSRARDAGHDVERAPPELGVDALEVAEAGADDGDRSVSRAPGVPLRRGIPAVAEQEIARGARAGREKGQVRGRAFEQNPAAVLARAGAEIDEMVGGPHHGFVVLDHDDRVARVAEIPEDAEELLRIRGVEAHGRLVEDVRHAAQPARRLSGQAEAPRVASREGVGGAIEGEMVEAEAQEDAGALQHGAADGLPGGALGVREREIAEERVEAAERQRSEVRDRAAVERDGESLGPEAPAAAGPAGEGAGEAEDVLVALAGERRIHDRQDALVNAFLPRPGGDPFPAHPRLEGMLAVGDADPVAPVEDDVLLFVGQVLPGDVRAEAVGPADAVEDVHGDLGIDDVAARRGDGQRALAQALRRIGHQETGIDPVLDPEAPAGGAGAAGRIEREESALEADPRRGVAEAGEEEPEEVVDLGQGPDRGARPGRGRRTAQGQGRGEAGDAADVGPPELAHELAGVGRERLQVAAPRLLVDDVEGEGGFARSRNAGDDREPAVGDVDVDGLEVVFGSLADDDSLDVGIAAHEVRAVTSRRRGRRAGRRTCPCRSRG